MSITSSAAHIARLARLASHAAAQVDRRYAEATKWQVRRDSLQLAHDALPATDRIRRERFSALADRADWMGRAWTWLAEGEPRSARAAWREALVCKRAAMETLV